MADSAAYATNAGTVGGLLASQFLQLANTAATTLSGNLTVPNLTVTSAVQVNGSQTVSGNLQVNGTLSAAATTGGGFVPIGGILMWSGDPGKVPSGWLLCNGSGTYVISGTTYSVPDLRDRFVVGAGGNYSSRSTGGNTSVTLGSNNLPPHRHTYKDTVFAENGIVGSGHSPDGLGTGVDGGNNYIGSKSSYDGDNSLSWVQRYSDYAQGNSGGGADSFDVRPPYYALAYIIRIQ